MLFDFLSLDKPLSLPLPLSYAPSTPLLPLSLSDRDTLIDINTHGSSKSGQHRKDSTWCFAHFELWEEMGEKCMCLC